MFFDFKKNRAWAENLAIVMQIGLTMAGCIVFCFFIGLYLDKWIGTRGIFVTLFTVLGVIGGAVGDGSTAVVVAHSERLPRRISAGMSPPLATM